MHFLLALTYCFSFLGGGFRLENRGFWPPKPFPKPSQNPPRCLQRQACQTLPHCMLALTYCFSFLGGVPKAFKVGFWQVKMFLCWGHVGSFFALGRLFFDLGRLLGVCWMLLAHVVRFFDVSGRSGSDFGASSDDFGRSETSFFEFLSRGHACKAKKLRMCKNHSFS